LRRISSIWALLCISVSSGLIIVGSVWIVLPQGACGKRGDMHLPVAMS